MHPIRYDGIVWRLSSQAETIYVFHFFAKWYVQRTYIMNFDNICEYLYSNWFAANESWTRSIAMRILHLHCDIISLNKIASHQWAQNVYTIWILNLFKIWQHFLEIFAKICMSYIFMRVTIWKKTNFMKNTNINK